LACGERLADCLLKRAARRLREKFSNPILLKQALDDIEAYGYKSHMWQYVKRILAEEIVGCIVEHARECFNGCLDSIYYADMTGGEHSYIQGHGGKDQDIVIYAPCPDLPREELEENIESNLEAAARIVISEALGFDPVEKLGIPNVVEIHIVRDERDTPYYNLVHSRVSRLVRAWPARRVSGQVFPF